MSEVSEACFSIYYSIHKQFPWCAVSLKQNRWNCHVCFVQNQNDVGIQEVLLLVVNPIPSSLKFVVEIIITYFNIIHNINILSTFRQASNL